MFSTVVKKRYLIFTLRQLEFLAFFIFIFSFIWTTITLRVSDDGNASSSFSQSPLRHIGDILFWSFYFCLSTIIYWCIMVRLGSGEGERRRRRRRTTYAHFSLEFTWFWSWSLVASHLATCILFSTSHYPILSYLPPPLQHFFLSDSAVPLHHCLRL
jgi:hypothetical protein